tara:strand:+ start:987 stop:1322 length:336 start_codon:yes stop_codon:yes gene_type:complete
MPDHLENPEHSQQAENANYQQGLASYEKHAEKGRYPRQEVDNPKKAEDIASRATHYPDSHEVFGHKEQGESPLRNLESSPPAHRERVDAIQHDRYNTQADCPQQQHIKSLP